MPGLIWLCSVVHGCWFGKIFKICKKCSLFNMSGTLCFSDMICCSRYILGSIELDLDHMSPYFFIFSIAKNKTFPRTGFNFAQIHIIKAFVIVGWRLDCSHFKCVLRLIYQDTIWVVRSFIQQVQNYQMCESGMTMFSQGKEDKWFYFCVLLIFTNKTSRDMRNWLKTWLLKLLALIWKEERQSPLSLTSYPRAW